MTTISLNDKINKSIYLLVLIFLLIDIGGAFGFKYFGMSILHVWAIIFLIFKKFPKRILLDLYLFTFFILTSLYSALKGVPPSAIYSQVSFIFFFPFLILGLNLKRNILISYFIQIVFIGSLIIIGTFLLILLLPNAYKFFNNFANIYRLGYLGFKPGYEDIPNVYYRWSMWLIPTLLYLIGGRIFYFIIVGIAVCLTLSTGIIVFCIIGSILILLISYNDKMLQYKYVLCLGLLFTVIILIMDQNHTFHMLAQNVFSKLSLQSISTSIKIGHIIGIWEAMKTSPLNLLLGMGAGSEFYSPGYDAFTINVEISHFNFFRQYGIFGTSIFLLYIFYIIFNLYKTDFFGKKWAVGLLMLFFAAGTNPLLTSPIFIIPLMIGRAYSLTFRIERNGSK